MSVRITSTSGCMAGALGAFVILAACTMEPSTGSPSATAGPATPSPSVRVSIGPSSGPAAVNGRLLLARNWTDEVQHWAADFIVSLDVATGEVLTAPWFADPELGLLRHERTWSPAGDMILSVAERRGVPPMSWVVLLPVDPAAPTVSLPEGVSVRRPTMSADGRWVAYSSDTDGSSSTLHLARRDGSHVLELPRTHEDYAWSPDGSTLGFLALDVAGGFTLSFLDAESGTVRDAGDARTNRNLFWSPDGSRLAYRGGGAECVLCLFDVSSGAVSPLVPDNVALVDPELAIAGWLDDATLLGHTEFGLPSTFYRLDPARGTADAIVELPSAGYPAISPDGRLLAFTADVATFESHVAILDLETSELRRLTPDGAGLVDWQATWQPKPVPLPWPAWSAPVLTPTSPPSAGTVRLTITGDRQVSGTAPATCQQLEDVEIQAQSEVFQVVLWLSPTGALSGFVVGADGFVAGSVEGFEPAPGAVVVAAGASPRSGSITFADLRVSGTGIGSISGSVAWECPGL